MQKLTFVLVLAALGFAGWQAFEAANLRDDLATQQSEQLELRGDIAQLSKTLNDLASREARGAPIAWEPAESGEGGGEPSDPTLAARGASPAVIARALQDLQGKVQNLEQENEELQEKVAKQPRTSPFKRPKFIRDLDSAEKELDLTSAQRADMERTIDWTKRELEDLFLIPNEDGKLFSEIEKMKVQGSEDFQIMMPNFAEIQKFKNSKVPGRTETYAEAEKRIRGRGKKDIRDTLTPEQQKTWDEAWTDPLFGESSGIGSFATTIVSSSTSSSDD